MVYLPTFGRFYGKCRYITPCMDGMGYNGMSCLWVLLNVTVMTLFFFRSASVHGLCELLGMARGRNEGCEGPLERIVT